MNAAASLAEFPEVAPRQKLTLGWRGKTELLPDIHFVEVAEVVAAPVARAERAIPVTPWTEPDALDICLDRWQAWMHRNDADLGTQTMKTLRGEGDGYGNDETADTRRNNEIAEATDAMIRSLSLSHRWAIRRKCGIATQWKFPQLDFMAEAIDACAELEKKLRNNVATRLLFS